MQIVKTRKLSLLYRAYRFRQQDYISIAPLLFFRLGTGMEIIEENKAYPDALSSLHDGAVLDVVMPKPQGEVLVGGHAYCPPGNPVRQRNIELRLGNVNKTLLVSGDRINRGMFHIRDKYQPELFEKLPLSYTLSYGSENNAYNPVGKGQQKNKDGVRELPNYEYPGLVRSKNRPAGFGPLDISWKPRKDKAGNYDEKWMKEDYPGLARDIDWSIYNAAPADQQVKGYFKGGEYYSLTGLHPDTEKIEGTLPRIRARAFLKFEETYGGEFRDVSCHAETVWFFPDRELGLIIYRGVTHVEDSDALDVSGLMLAHEHLDDSPRETAYYEEAYQLRTDPETKRLHAFNESQLSPVKSDEEIAALAMQQLQAEKAYLEKKQSIIDAHMQDMLDKTGLEPAGDFEWPKAEPEEIPVMSEKSAASGDFDLTAVMESTDKLVKEMEAEKEKQLQQLNVFKESVESAVATPVINDDDMKNAIQVKIAPVSFSRDLENLEDVSSADEESAEKIKLASERQARRHTPDDISDAAELNDPARDMLAAEIRCLLDNGQSLAGRDLAGANLKGIDFSGLDMTEVMLEDAVLDDCNFSNCQLQGAVFTGASLNGTSFNHALLRNTNFSKCTGTKTDFREAVIEDALFSTVSLDKAGFKRCRLVRIDASFAVLVQADFTGAEILQFNILDGDLSGCNLNDTQIRQMVSINTNKENSNWQGATIERSAFVQCHAEFSDFTGASLDSLQTGGNASFTGASFRNARGHNCGWRGDDFSGADFQGSVMQKCDFGEAVFDDVNMDNAVLYQSILSGARFSKCSFIRSNLHKAQARKAQFQDCDFTRANLVDANITEAKFDNCHLKKIEILNRDMLQT